MTYFFEKLVEDHKNINMALLALDQQISFYDQGDVEPDLYLILNILEYLRSYPELFHHPLEEKAFDYLEKNNIGEVDVICSIRQQHLTLEKRTSILCDSFYSVANDCVVPIDVIKKQLSDYVHLQKYHLETENVRIFPTLETLDSAAWDEIIQEMPEFNDRLLSGEEGGSLCADLLANIRHDYTNSPSYTSLETF